MVQHIYCFRDYIVKFLVKGDVRSTEFDWSLKACMTLACFLLRISAVASWFPVTSSLTTNNLDDYKKSHYLITYSMYVMPLYNIYYNF
ncbi:hypothetical protein EB796_022774 [Bugula neritina]|uniref:Uncharacterized protein n=1 Tax=Bugula neritina TaxID=10212 RepID=A0A7J7IY97_BUGNE|nr:hypothetical protein EB796_022774 [Bugula neritina]